MNPFYLWKSTLKSAIIFHRRIMIIVKNEDLFVVKFESLLADYDRETLANLYQPIIGYEAMSLFFTLWSEGNNQRVISITNHKDMICRMQISMTDFIKARRKLESVGLVTTKLEKVNDSAIYTYHLYAPKTPFQFFDDTLFYGLLIKSVGEVTANRLKNLYHMDKDVKDGEDISASFGEVFHPDFNDPIFTSVASTPWNSLGRIAKKMNLEFSYEEFFHQLSLISQINESAFNKKEMKEIARMASLYGVDEINAASIVSTLYRPDATKGSRLDFNELNHSFQDETHYQFLTKKKTEETSLIHSDTDMAKLINDMETISPKDYLFVLQNGTKPCSSDLKIIDGLSKDYHFANGVINVIVSFTLSQNNNVLSKAYCEKIASSLARSNIETAIDAMNFLNDHLKNKKKDSYLHKNQEVNSQNSEEKLDNADNKQSEENLAEEWDKMFEEDQ